MNKLLSTRNKMKSKKPEFERQNCNIFRQFRGMWRKPKGIHSKLRRGFRGHKMAPSIGFASPKAVCGLNRKGLLPVIVLNVNDLNKVEKDCVAVIGASVGMKKRVQVLTKAKEKNIVVLGYKDIDTYITKVNEKLGLKKQESSVKKEEKKKKIEEVKKKETKTEDKKNESKK